jgi:hypothetical protein
MIQDGFYVKERTFWFISCIILLLICTVFIALYINTQNELDKLKDSETYTTYIPTMSNGLYAHEIKWLVRQGLQNPVEDLAENLTENPGLIPFEGTLGGTFGFYDPDSIYVLTPRWVFARFEDGHIAGAMLLEYSVSNDTIHWKVVDAYIEN